MHWKLLLLQSAEVTPEVFAGGISRLRIVQERENPIKLQCFVEDF